MSWKMVENRSIATDSCPDSAQGQPYPHDSLMYPFQTNCSGVLRTKSETSGLHLHETGKALILLLVHDSCFCIRQWWLFHNTREATLHCDHSSREYISVFQMSALRGTLFLFTTMQRTKNTGLNRIGILLTRSAKFAPVSGVWQLTAQNRINWFWWTSRNWGLYQIREYSFSAETMSCQIKCPTNVSPQQIYWNEQHVLGRIEFLTWKTNAIFVLTRKFWNNRRHQPWFEFQWKPLVSSCSSSTTHSRSTFMDPTEPSSTPDSASRFSMLWRKAWISRQFWVETSLLLLMSKMCQCLERNNSGRCQNRMKQLSKNKRGRTISRET